MTTTAPTRLDRHHKAPDWRWQVVTALVADNRMPARTLEDPSIWKGCRYLLRSRKAHNADLLNLEHDYPDLYAAHAMYVNPSSERWIIEAGLLTSAGRREVADYSGHTETAVEMYHHMFFDVRSRLHARGFILNRILMPTLARGAAPRDPDFMYKTLAYCAGWRVFLEYIDRRDLSDETRIYLQGGFKDGLLRRGWEAVQRVDVNNYNAPLLIDSTLKLLEMEQAKGGVAARDEMNRLMANLLDNCRMTVMPSDADLRQYEPRVSELIGHEAKRLRFGDDVPLVAAVATPAATPAL
jgi:hypothetical protein